MKQSLVNTSTSLLREKSAASTSIIPVPELSENIEDDIYALEYYNELLDTGVPRTVAHMEALDDAGNAAQELAQKGKGNLVVIDDFINGQNQAAAAAKLSTGSIIAQSVASAALTGAISMGVTLADKEKTAELERQREELTAPCVPIENSVCANPNEWRRRCFLW